jgi:hypothetical protein
MDNMRRTPQQPRRALPGLLFLAAVVISFGASAQEQDVSGVWTGSTTCPLGASSVTVNVQGNKGTFVQSYTAGSPAPQSTPVSVRFMKGHQGLWVYFQADGDYHDGLLAVNGRTLKMDGMGDCRDYVLVRRAASSDQAAAADDGTRPRTEAPSLPGQEPTETEMRGALELELAEKGNASRTPGEFRTENALSGMSVQLQDFEKLGCARAQGRAGFQCDYMVRMGMKMYSTEGSAAGDAHAEAVNNLMEMITGGQSASAQQNASARFVRARGRWVVLRD